MRPLAEAAMMSGRKKESAQLICFVYAVLVYALVYA